MVCEHLAIIEQALLNANVAVNFQGQAWSKQCRQWVYFDCILDIPRLRNDFELAPCVDDHEHFGTHDGQELGIVCKTCLDGIIGIHPKSKPDAVVFP